MQIEWKIRKRAGNLRPRLVYRISLEPFETDLAVPMVRMVSTIPKPKDPWQSHEWPGHVSPGSEAPAQMYDLCTPSHKSVTCEDVLTLPLRPDSRYPEVEESFLALRAAFESVLIQAFERSAFETSGRLELSEETKRRIAPEMARSRFLDLLTTAS